MADSSLLRNVKSVNNKKYTMVLANFWVKMSRRGLGGAAFCCDPVYLSALWHPSYKHRVSYRYRDVHRIATIGIYIYSYICILRALVYSLLQGMLGVCHIGVHTDHRLVEAIICRAEALLSLHVPTNNTNNVRGNVGNSP